MRKEGKNMRKVKREVTIGNLTIGGHNPVAVQTMLNVRADDVAGNVAQAVRVAEAGCQIVRVSVPTLEDVRLIEAIKNAVDIPLVADIHFNHRIALACVDAGVDKIRLNPGNIGGDDHVKEVAAACKAKNIPIRIGVNAGSLEKRCWPSTARRCPKRWWKAPCTTSLCWKNTILTTSSSPSSPAMCPG